MTEQPLVNFLIAGVQKGGTTALFDYLAGYPDVVLPDFERVPEVLHAHKELHFFDDDSLDWDRPDYAAYHARFTDPAGRPCGEATPIYAYWPKSLERIAAYNPAMKLIMVLRDPIQRAWSQWRMEFSRGFETHPFAWCIRQGRQRLFDAEPWGHHPKFSYVERGFYGEQIERLYGLFPREQVLVLTSDALRADPGFAMGEVRALLSLGPAAAPEPREAHVGTKMTYPSELTTADIDYLRQVYALDAERLAALTGVRFG